MRIAQSGKVVVVVAVVCLCCAVGAWVFTLHRTSDPAVSVPNTVQSEAMSPTQMSAVEAQDLDRRVVQEPEIEGAPAQPAIDVPVSTIDPRVLTGSDTTFKSVQDLEHNDVVNPRHVVLTPAQRASLQKLLDEAESAVSTARQELQIAVNSHGRALIDQGLGWDVPPGQLAKLRDPKHTSIYTTYSIDKGTRACSFDCRSEPDTAPLWENKVAVIGTYNTKIAEFFNSL